MGPCLGCRAGFSLVNGACIAVSCPLPVAPARGSVSAPKLTYGSPATYSCQTGYHIEGPTVRTCQSNRLWSGSG